LPKEKVDNAILDVLLDRFILTLIDYEGNLHRRLHTIPRVSMRVDAPPDKISFDVVVGAIPLRSQITKVLTDTPHSWMTATDQTIRDKVMVSLLHGDLQTSEKCSGQMEGTVIGTADRGALLRFAGIVAGSQLSRNLEKLLAFDH
jgi:hypothetical protein